MSSIQAIHDQLGEIEHVIVCVDPVDLDNIWQCLWALVRAPNAHIHITLSPRVLDLRVPTFANLFGELMLHMGPQYMLKVLSKDATEMYGSLKLFNHKGLQEYFRRDTTFKSDPHTAIHMKLYMALSALRFASRIVSKGHLRSRYTFYWDPLSMTTITPGIRHPTHVNDYLYACNDKDRGEALNYLHLCGPEREEKMVKIMDDTAERLARELGYRRPADILHPIEELNSRFNNISSHERTLILGGGPFTEMVRILRETELVPLAIVAMARTLWADTNIFNNNYNDLMDLRAAWDIEQIVKDRDIPTWFFPTECAKSKVEGPKVLRPCHWDFSTDELISIFKAANDMESYDQAAAFARETNTQAKIHMFDVLAVVPLTYPDSLPYRRFESYWDHIDGEPVIRIREAANGPINVFYPDEKKMAASKEQAMQEISHVLSSINDIADITDKRLM